MIDAGINLENNTSLQPAAESEKPESLQKKITIFKATLATSIAALLAGCGVNPDIQAKVQEALTEAPTTNELVVPQEGNLGYYEAKVQPGTLVEDGVDQAYYDSLIKNGYSPEEAQQYKEQWGQLIPGATIVVTSEERGVEVFRGVRPFWEVAINDVNRYPNGAEVRVAGNPQDGGDGSLAQYVRNSGRETTVYEWGQQFDGTWATVSSADGRVSSGAAMLFGIDSGEK